MATSLLAGCVIFSVLGYMANIRDVSIDNLGLEGIFIYIQKLNQKRTYHVFISSQDLV